MQAVRMTPKAQQIAVLRCSIAVDTATAIKYNTKDRDLGKQQRTIENRRSA